MCGIFFHNVNIVLKRNKENDNKRNGLSDREAMQQYTFLGADIICLCETNISGKNKYLGARWKCEVRKSWKGRKLFFNSIHTDSKEEHLYRGCCIIVAPRLAPYAQHVQTDDFGLFVAVTMKGQNSMEVTIVLAYKPNKG